MVVINWVDTISIVLLVCFAMGGLYFYIAAVVLYYYRNRNLYPFQLLFKNDFEAKTFISVSLLITGMTVETIGVHFPPGLYSRFVSVGIL